MAGESELTQVLKVNNMSAEQLRMGKKAEFLSELKNTTIKLAYDS